jgi:nitrite reductase/ring-hydroxylating ferredoxin subunit
VTDLCALDDVAPGSGRVFAFGEGKASVGVVIVRSTGEGTVSAFVNLCPHFWIPLNVRETPAIFRDHVLCANHYAAFRFSDGYCVEGPCVGSSLDAVPFEIRDGRIAIKLESVKRR